MGRRGKALVCCLFILAVTLVCVWVVVRAQYRTALLSRIVEAHQAFLAEIRSGHLVVDSTASFHDHNYVVDKRFRTSFKDSQLAGRYDIARVAKIDPKRASDPDDLGRLSRHERFVCEDERLLITSAGSAAVVNSYPPSRLKGMQYHRSFQPYFFSFHVGGASLPQWIQENAAAIEVGKGGQGLILLTHRDRRNDREVRVWIDPGRGYRIVRSEFQRQSHRSSTVIELLRYDPGVWYPREIVQENYTATNGRWEPTIMQTWRVEKAEFGVSIADDAFTLRALLDDASEPSTHLEEPRERAGRKTPAIDNAGDGVTDRGMKST